MAADKFDIKIIVCHCEFYNMKYLENWRKGLELVLPKTKKNVKIRLEFSDLNCIFKKATKKSIHFFKSINKTGKTKQKKIFLRSSKLRSFMTPRYRQWEIVKLWWKKAKKKMSLNAMEWILTGRYVVVLCWVAAETSGSKW